MNIKQIFWLSYDFFVLCVLGGLIVSVFFLHLQDLKIQRKLYNLKTEMKALHQDMIQVENQLFQKQYIIIKQLRELQKDNRPEIHVHGDGEGSVKLFNVDGEIIVEVLEEFQDLENKK